MVEETADEDKADVAIAKIADAVKSLKPPQKTVTERIQASQLENLALASLDASVNLLAEGIGDLLTSYRNELLPFVNMSDVTIQQLLQKQDEKIRHLQAILREG